MRASVLLVPVMLVASSVSALSVQATGLPQASSRIERSTLASGLLVITERRAASEVTGVALAVRAGSRLEAGSSQGAAHMLAHLYLQGTPTRPSRAAVVSPIFASGGSIDVRPDWETISFFGTVPVGHTDVLIDTIGDVVQRSAFQPGHFELMRGLIELELREETDNPSDVASRALLGTMLRSENALGYPTGSAKGLQHLTLDAVLGHHRQLVGANRAAIAVVSPLEHGAIVDRVERAFSGFATAPGRGAMSVSFDPPRGQQVTIASASDRAEVHIGVPIPGAHDPDRPVFEVIVGALNGFTGRLTQQVRVIEGLTYGTGAWISLSSSEDFSILRVAASTYPESAEIVLDLLRAELDRLRAERLSARELQRAVSVARSSASLSQELAVDRASSLAIAALIGLPIGAAIDTGDLATVTADDMLRVARTYLTRERMFEVVVRP